MSFKKIVLIFATLLLPQFAHAADRFFVVSGDGVEVSAEPNGFNVFLYCKNTTDSTLSYHLTNVTLWVDGQRIGHWNDLGGQSNLAPGSTQNCAGLLSNKFTSNGAKVKVEASINAQ